MRILYLSLCLMAVSASPARTFKRNYARKMEVTEKVEPIEKEKNLDIEASDKVEPVTEKEDKIDLDKTQDTEVNSRSLYESVNVVSSTIASISDRPQEFTPHVVNLPQVNIGWQALPTTQAPKTEEKKEEKITLRGRDGPENVYEVNIYINFNEDGVFLEEEGRKKRPKPKPQRPQTTTTTEDYDYWYLDYVNFSTKDKSQQLADCPNGFKKVNGRCAQKKCQKGEALVGNVCTPIS